MAPGAGRFAPSPSADLHIGNLRTAMLAWLFARSTGRRFLIRVEDLDDRTYADIGNRQLDDLAAIGLTWDEPPEWQTEHTDRYDAAIDGTVGSRVVVRMLLQPKGYRPGSAGASRSAGRVSRDVPRPHRHRT